MVYCIGEQLCALLQEAWKQTARAEARIAGKSLVQCLEAQEQFSLTLPLGLTRTDNGLSSLEPCVKQ